MNGLAQKEVLLQKLHAAALKVGTRFSAHPDVAAVLVFGSAAFGQVDDRSDVDVLVVCQRESVPLDDRRRLLEQVGSHWRFGEDLAGNDLFTCGDVDGLVDGVAVTVHYQSARWITEVLDAVLQGAITCEQLPFRPYTLPAVLQEAWVLYDKDKVVAGWLDRVSRFPLQLKLNLLRHFVPVLREHTEELRANAERGLGPRVFIFSLNWAVDALTGILFAVNDVYDPADKRVERDYLPRLSIVPPDFLPRLKEVLEGPFNDAGARHRAVLFEQLANEVLALADKELAQGS